LNGEPLFDVIKETDRFDLDTLRALANELEQEAPIRGVLGILGMLSRDGLVSAHIAALAEERGLPSQGADALYRANNKYLTRDAMRAAGMKQIEFGLATDEQTLLAEAERIGYPLIMKPLTGVASHLILKCDNQEELVERFRLAMAKLPESFNKEVYAGAHHFPTRSGEIKFFDPLRCMLMEAYIPGREVSVEMVLTEEEVIPLLVHDKVKMTEKDRVFYEDLLVVPPQRFTEQEVQAMKDYAVAAVRAVGLKNMNCHVELRYHEEMGPQLLEINPRVGGICIIDSLQTMVGYDAVQAQLELAQGTFVPAESYASKTELHAMFPLYPPHAGILEAVHGLDELKQMPGVISATLTAPIGSTVNGDDEEVFLLVCWMQGESLEHVYQTYEKACELVKFDVKRVTDTENVSL
jgi:biotin carboxylase